MNTTPLEPPTRLDREPAILWGCTQPELFALLALALLLAAPVGLVFAVVAHIGLISFGHLALPLVGVVTYALVRAGAARLRQLKRGRPDHYFRVRLQLALARLGLLSSPFLSYSGPWRLGRD